MQGIDRSMKVIERYPMKINPYFLKVADDGFGPLGRQVIPDVRELEDREGMVDPLAEDSNSPVACITHRYPDRVLFLVCGECAVYCRFCTRKRKIGKWEPPKDEAIEEGFRYIRGNRSIHDVLLSGGDPFLLSDARLKWILETVKAIPHVGVVRIGTRVPCVLPQRVTSGLIAVLKRFLPLYINLHFNHPDEITKDARIACLALLKSGCHLGSQTVLLKGVNDHPETVMRLVKTLIQTGIRPYYLLQADLTKGTGHFRTSIHEGLNILSYLRGRVSGLAIPQYVVDLPGGGGKVPLVPEYLVRKEGGDWIFRNPFGREYRYPGGEGPHS